MVNVAFKIDGGVVKQIDSLAEELSRAQPGLTITRTDVVRLAIHQYLKDRGQQKKQGK